MFEKYISWVSKEAHLVDHIHINLVLSSFKLDYRFLESGNTKVLNYNNCNDRIR
ncbi:unnamed protein product [Lupinus luteus]|uniref:Uncharacterized protein n=1 Tax=Lupinus luteus TaxID=3873 RepID=A0AAV1Y7B3_LUPLU